MSSLVLTLIGDDRPGLVSAVSGLVEARGGSWQRSQMARLSGKFAGIALVEVPDGEVDALEVALEGLAGTGLQVRVERTVSGAGVAPGAAGSGDGAAGGSDRAVTDVRLHLLGQDRPGIVAEISAALASHGVGIDELSTDVSDAPMAGGTLFEVDALLSFPADAEAIAVRADLERLADELMVDLQLDAPTPGG